MPPIHKNLASGSWTALSRSQQLANIGSEVNRVIHWAQAGDEQEKDRAMERALELLDLTLSGIAVGTDTSELVRLREVLCDVFLGPNEYGTSTESLEEYFLPFALRARH